MGTIQVVFPELVNYFEITAGDQGGDTDSFKIEAYDSIDNLLDYADTGIFGGNPLVYTGYYGDSATLSLSVSDIAYALLIPTSPSDAGISWDDLVYEPQAPVPEPATMLLLGFGLIGLALGRKKFFRKGR